jgi:transcriptional regulator of arginine metabolism
MERSSRLKTITALVSSQPITHQGQLLGLLSGSGYKVTQASVSRDLDRLGIRKVGGRYSLPEKRLDSTGSEKLTLHRAGDNLVIARCAPGMASAAAVRIDALRLSEVVGTIAGDDTIFIAVAGPEEQRTVTKKIMEMY